MPITANSFTKEKSELYRQFQRLKPKHSTNDEAIQSAAHDLEVLAAQRSQTVEALIKDAHTTKNTQPHHVQALTLERIIARLRPSINK